MNIAKKFKALVVQRGGAEAVAKELGCSRPYVDMIRTGRRRPGLALAFRIERWSEGALVMREWTEEEGVASLGGQ